MSDERTFCAICGVNADGAEHCPAHDAAAAARDRRTWCDVCGVATTDGAALCEAHEARRALETAGQAWCEVCGKARPCERHELEDGDGDEEDTDDPARTAIGIAKTPLAKGNHGNRRKRR